MRKLNVGDILIIKDEQTLRDQMENNLTLSGLTTEVIESNTIRTDISNWSIYKLEHGDLVLVDQETDGFHEYCLYFPIDGFQPGNREDLRESKSDWMFEEDENATLNELEYAKSIDSESASYHRKMNTVWGEDSEDYFAGVTEWETEASIENPHIICTEIGDMDNELGGYIEIYQGCRVDESELELMEK